MSEIVFGQIPFDLICRFGELTKNEIQLVSYLYACRNQITGQCNPSRKKISDETGLIKTNLSRAISGAEEKCWLLDQKEGFILFEAYRIDELLRQKESESYQIDNKNTEKVINLITNDEPEVIKLITNEQESYQIDNNSDEKVINLITNPGENLPTEDEKVINLITESNQIDNQLNKDLNIKGTENINTIGEQSSPNVWVNSELNKIQKKEFGFAMEYLKARIGKFPDPGGQGKALKWMMLEGATLDQIKKGLDRQILEYKGAPRDYRVSYLTLQKDIFRWIKEAAEVEQPKELIYVDESEDLPAENLSDEARKHTLASFKIYVNKGQELFILSQRSCYTEDDWQWLMDELNLTKGVGA